MLSSYQELFQILLSISKRFKTYFLSIITTFCFGSKKAKKRFYFSRTFCICYLINTHFRHHEDIAKLEKLFQSRALLNPKRKFSVNDFYFFYDLIYINGSTITKLILHSVFPVLQLHLLGSETHLGLLQHPRWSSL